MPIPTFITIGNDMDVSDLHSDLSGHEVQECRRWERTTEDQSCRPNCPRRRMSIAGDESKGPLRPAMDGDLSSQINEPPSLPKRRQSATLSLGESDVARQDSCVEESEEEELNAAIMGLLSTLSTTDSDSTNKDSKPHIPRRRGSVRSNALPRCRWVAYAA